MLTILIMKITFQNVRSINDEKTKFLVKTLKDYDLLCLSELNKVYDFNKPNINDNEFQYHTDLTTSRIGVMACNTLKLKFMGIGISLTQERVQVDKSVIQSNIYKIIENKRSIYIENVYCVPDASNENISKLIEHLVTQSKKYKYYLVGGDFNINWKEFKNRKLFDNLPLSQIVKEYTRVQKYNKTTIDKTTKIKTIQPRVSKSLIDLVFVSTALKPFVRGVVVDLLLDKFDHKSVTVDLDFPEAKRSRVIRVPLNPLQRKSPTEEQSEKIKNELKDLKPSSLDSFFGGVRSILDKFIPTNPRNTSINKTIFRTPLPKEVVVEVKKKKKLSKCSRSSKNNWKQYKLQRNKVTD